MYYKSRYGIAPRTFGGLIEDVFQNGANFFHDDVPVRSSVPVNIKETDKSYEVHVVAPGLNKEDIKINVERDMLTISFEQKEEQAESKWLRNEYHFRSFKRSFTLNEKVDVANINAKYNDGILYVSLPKKENVEPAAHQISVN
jgi:HSP20 family protein